MTTIPTHISRIRPGDTVEVGCHLKTVSPGDIRRGFMGTTLWGDSYRLGTLPVRRVVGPGAPHQCPHGHGFNCAKCWPKSKAADPITAYYTDRAKAP